MRKILSVILVSLSFPFNICIAAESIKGKVVSVSSGDLISFQDEYGEIRQVSMYGIDAPDDKQKMGEHAQKMLSAMVSDKDIEVKIKADSPNKIPAAHVSINGLSINAAMVKSGCAWVDSDACKATNCSTWIEYQNYARENKKGLWVDPGAEPPWEWRERRSKAEAIAKRVNEESDFVTYYGSLANSGHRSLWAQKTLPSVTVFSSSSSGNAQGAGSYAGSGAVASKSGSATKPKKVTRRG